jgi:hypothetical protein
MCCKKLPELTKQLPRRGGVIAYETIMLLVLNLSPDVLTNEINS